MRKTQGIRARKEGKGWGGLHAGRNEDARGGGGSTGGAGRSSGPRPASHRTFLRGQPPRVRALALAALAGVLTLAALATPAHAQTGIISGWSLKPAGLTVGTKFRLLFLSSTGRVGDDSNIAVYNTFIQARAKVGHTDIRDYSAGFRVVGCTSNTDARDNTATTYTQADKGVRIYWLGGAKVADNYEDFYDGSWDEERHDKNERGTNGPDTSLHSNLPYTGCAHDGTEDTFAGSSRALGPHRTRVGRPNFSGSHNGPLSSGVDGLVGQIRPMYGLSEVFEVKEAPTASNATVTTNEDVEYGFRAADFNFVGIASNDSLARVKITTLPTNGALELNGTALTSSDLPQTVTATDTPQLRPEVRPSGERQRDRLHELHVQGRRRQRRQRRQLRLHDDGERSRSKRRTRLRTRDGQDSGEDGVHIPCVRLQLHGHRERRHAVEHQDHDAAGDRLRHAQLRRRSTRGRATSRRR